MRLNFNESLALLRETYPFMRPYAYVPFGNGYIFNLIDVESDPKEAIANFCILNPDTKKVSGCISAMQMFKDPKFEKLWDKAVLVKKNVGSAAWSFNFLPDSNYLMHYGIKGQRWGVSNGPPYPLDQKTHNKVIKTGQKSERYKNVRAKGNILPDALETIDKLGKVNVKKSEKLNQQRTIANEKLSNKLLWSISDNRVFSESNPPKEIKGNHSIDDDLRDTNPLYDPFNSSGTTNNCALCSFTYDLRRRGYDVTAKASVTGVQPKRSMKDLYEDPKMDVIAEESWPDVFKTASEYYPEGARGVVSMVGGKGKNGYGHAVVFEIQNGKCVFLDPQINDRHTAVSLTLAKNFDPQYVEFIRTDNLKVNFSKLNTICNEFKDSWKHEADGHNPDWAKKSRGGEPSLDEMGKMLDINFDDENEIKKYAKYIGG